ncbi:polymorphic toxin type 15 domain-containing protein [Solibacillus sp. FSL R7-0682]|uniref:polymorphic toxin type 15 domain-containing protein n=1 Tax=Solibacillus sp. FSL R7-0682 TaxID=2921690 RepID=UPI0030F99927
MTKVGGKVAVAYTSFKEGGYKGVISAGLDFIPIVGNAKALVEAAIGRDPITGRKLESWERGASAAAILGGPLVKGVKHGAKLGAKAISGATSSSKKTVNLAKSPTPSNPPKQQAPSQAKKEASATTATPAKANQNTKGTGNIKRIPETLVKFNYNPKHDSAEFTRQLKAQEEGMNKLTVDEYLKNRQKYIDEGRAVEGNLAQQAAREQAYTDKVIELREKGLSSEAAEKEASKWMDTQAALHNPDQIAGGNPSLIDGMGDRRVNSSLGAQWKYRIDAVDEHIKKAAEGMSEAEKKSTYLNVKLTQ